MCSCSPASWLNSVTSRFTDCRFTCHYRCRALIRLDCSWDRGSLADHTCVVEQTIETDTNVVRSFCIWQYDMTGLVLHVCTQSGVAGSHCSLASSTWRNCDMVTVNPPNANNTLAGWKVRLTGEITKLTQFIIAKNSKRIGTTVLFSHIRFCKKE